ncbi:MAG: xylulokinase [Opitutales bacterium]
MSYSLGIDASTQSCSAIVIDLEHGAILAEKSISFGEHLPQYHAPSGFIPNGPHGEVHSDPRMWLDALEALFAELKESCDLSQVSCISGAGQQHGSVYLNDQWFETVAQLNPAKSLNEQLSPCLSRATSPIWMDTSTGGECREIAEAVGGNAQVCAKSGSIAIERFTGPQIRRFFKTNPEDYEATKRIHLVSSFLCSVIAGVDAPIDHGDGAGMNLLNINTWAWDPALLEATAPDLRERLPEAAPGHTQVGTVAPFFAEKYGLRTDTPVNIFTGDNPSSLVGMGASRPGKVVISLGTSDTFFAAMPEVIADPSGCGHVFGNPSGGSMSLQCFVNGSLAREAVKDQFAYDWDQFTKGIENTPAGNEGRLMVPFFRPEISPRVDLGSPILKGDTSFENGTDADATVRACVEGQFLNMKLRTDWMRLHTDVIYLTGGASQNDAIAQIVADIFQAEVQRLAVSGSVGLGAALRAANNCLGRELEELERQFCKPEPGSSLAPSCPAETYREALQGFQRLI